MFRLTLVAALALAATAAHAEETTIDCLAEPAQRIQLGSAVTGLLAAVDVGRGDQVTPGQVLARLDSKVEEANLAMARAQAEATEALEAQRTRLTLAQASLERSQKLMASGAVTQAKIEELQATAEIAQRDFDTEVRRLRLAGLEVERQATLLKRQSIVSPIKGFVTEQMLHAGEFVRQDSPIMTIVQTDPLYVEAYIPVQFWGKIVKGSRGTVSLDQPAGTSRQAQVTVVDPIFDAASATIVARLELPNADNGIPAGQRCTLKFAFPDAVAATP